MLTPAEVTSTTLLGSSEGGAPGSQVAGPLLMAGPLQVNLDHVTAMEHLLKSVLLYPINNSAASSSTVTCVWNLVVEERAHVFQQDSPKSLHLP